MISFDSRYLSLYSSSWFLWLQMGILNKIRMHVEITNFLTFKVLGTGFEGFEITNL